MAAKSSNESSPLRRWLLWPFRFVLLAGGWCFIAVVTLAFTPLPWRAYDALGDGGPVLQTPPDYIVILGGGGIPSESGLMRTYYGALAARHYLKARVVVACPGEAAKTNSTVGQMRAELMMRGVAAPRIIFEDKGRHTHEQAVNCFKLLNASGQQPSVLLVTSPEHMRRGLLSFRKAGFTNISGTSAQSVAVEVDLRFNTEELKSKSVPDVGQSMMVRYKFWNNLVAECNVAREVAALAYYKFLGWI